MTKQFTGDKPTIDEIMALRKPRTHEVWIPLDGEILAEIDDLEQQIARAERIDEREHRDPQAPALREQLDELRERAEEAAARFVFRELPRKQYRDLIDAHPAVKEGRRWNDETFCPALIAASCVEPAITAERALELWESWNDACTSILAGAAILVNEGSTKIPFGVRSSAVTADSVQSSPTAPLEG